MAICYDCDTYEAVSFEDDTPRCLVCRLYYIGAKRIKYIWMPLSALPTNTFFDLKSDDMGMVTCIKLDKSLGVVASRPFSNKHYCIPSETYVRIQAK